MDESVTIQSPKAVNSNTALDKTTPKQLTITVK